MAVPGERQTARCCKAMGFACAQPILRKIRLPTSVRWVEQGETYRNALSGKVALIVLLARPRDPLQRLGRVRLLSRQIAQRHDADEALVAAHHRPPAHL